MREPSEDRAASDRAGFEPAANDEDQSLADRDQFGKSERPAKRDQDQEASDEDLGGRRRRDDTPPQSHSPPTDTPESRQDVIAA